MKTIGILGGLGPEATADYYKEIIKGFNLINQSGRLDYPEMVIYSVTMSKFIAYLENGCYSQAADYLADCFKRMQLAGAQFGVISANTPHLLFHEIQDRVELPLISIVDVCARRAARMGLGKCALLGTKFTMKSDFYAHVFKTMNIEIVVPDARQIEFIHYKLFSELELGVFLESTKLEILAVVESLKIDHDIDSVILGCTEFPIMFTEPCYLDIPFLNTTQIHVEAIIEECLKP